MFGDSKELEAEQWDSLPQARKLELCHQIAGNHNGLSFWELDHCQSPHDEPALRSIGRFRYYDEHETNTLMLIPGGLVELGLAGDIRETLRELAPSTSFEKFDSDGVIANFESDAEAAGAFFSQRRKLHLPAVLVERDTRAFSSYVGEDEDDEEEILQGIVRGPWRLPTMDEWEYLYSGGCRSFFPWGDSWPARQRHTSNLFGLSFVTDHECTSEYLQLAGGDPSGWYFNSYDSAIVQASSYFPHSSHIANFAWEAYEAAGVRRVFDLR